MSVTYSYTQSQTRLQTSVTELNVATAHWRRNFANAHLAAVLKFKAGGEDPQDSVLVFERFLGVVERETMSDSTAQQERKQAMLTMRMDAHRAEEMDRIDREYGEQKHGLFPPTTPDRDQDDAEGRDDHAFAGAMQERRLCKFGDQCRRQNCSFYHPAAAWKQNDAGTNARTRPGRQQEMRRDPGYNRERPPSFQSRFSGQPVARKCFAEGCQLPPFRGKALCVECHKKAVQAGSIKCKDGNTQAYQADIAATDVEILECSQAFHASAESKAQQEEIWDKVREQGQQEQREAYGAATRSYTETDLVEMYKMAMQDGAAMERETPATSQKHEALGADTVRDSKRTRVAESGMDILQRIQKRAREFNDN